MMRGSARKTKRLPARLTTARTLAARLLFASLVAVSLNSAANAFSFFETWTISDHFKTDTVRLTASARFRLTASARFAGAISSLTWNGVEFIDASDHGRELQSAANFDRAPECYNPTEAGSSSDKFTSSSKLLSISARGNRLESRTRMAFWLPPGQSSPACPIAKNAVTLSDHELAKTVTISGNVIAHDVTFHVPRHYRNAVFEALTAYLPERFNTFWTYDVRSQQLRPLSDGPGEQPLPVIVATEDRRFALGVYSPSLPQPARPNGGYGRWRFKDERVTKWNCVFRLRDVSPGAHAFRCYTIVGSLEDVRSAMQTLVSAKTQ
jgi:hypothetical protein